MRGSTHLAPMGNVLLLVAMLAVGGCGGADDPVTPEPADFSGEYAYEIQASGGDCSLIPSSYGYGVTRVTQAGSAATMCWQNESCDGEHCQSGMVDGKEFRYVVSRTITDGTCTYLRTTTFVSTLQPNGDALGRGDTVLTYQSGDCSDRELPCSTWYTVVDRPCGTPCYDVFCASRSRAVKTGTSSRTGD